MDVYQPPWTNAGTGERMNLGQHRGMWWAESRKKVFCCGWKIDHLEVDGVFSQQWIGREREAGLDKPCMLDPIPIPQTEWRSSGSLGKAALVHSK